MSPYRLRARLRRAFRAFSGEDIAAHKLNGAILRSVLRSRGGMIVVPEDCWSMTKDEGLIWEAKHLGPSGPCFVLSFTDDDMVAGGYQGAASNAARIET